MGKVEGILKRGGVKRSTGHTQTHTDREQHPDTDTHTHDKNNTPNPQTNTPHKHLTTLEGGATTVPWQVRPRASLAVEAAPCPLCDRGGG